MPEQEELSRPPDPDLRKQGLPVSFSTVLLAFFPGRFVTKAFPFFSFLPFAPKPPAQRHQLRWGCTGCWGIESHRKGLREAFF